MICVGSIQKTNSVRFTEGQTIHLTIAPISHVIPKNFGAHLFDFALLQDGLFKKLVQGSQHLAKLHPEGWIPSTLSVISMLHHLGCHRRQDFWRSQLPPIRFYLFWQILFLLINEAISSISRFLQSSQLADNNAASNNEDDSASTNDTDIFFVKWMHFVNNIHGILLGKIRIFGSASAKFFNAP